MSKRWRLGEARERGRRVGKNQARSRGKKLNVGRCGNVEMRVGAEGRQGQAQRGGEGANSVRSRSRKGGVVEGGRMSKQA